MNFITSHIQHSKEPPPCHKIKRETRKQKKKITRKQEVLTDFDVAINIRKGEEDWSFEDNGTNSPLNSQNYVGNCEYPTKSIPMLGKLESVLCSVELPQKTTHPPIVQEKYIKPIKGIIRKQQNINPPF